jgi:hypothetical protein
MHNAITFGCTMPKSTHEHPERNVWVNSGPDMSLIPKIQSHANDSMDGEGRAKQDARAEARRREKQNSNTIRLSQYATTLQPERKDERDSFCRRGAFITRSFSLAATAACRILLDIRRSCAGLHINPSRLRVRTLKPENPQVV